jgi:hypothetical protein
MKKQKPKTAGAEALLRAREQAATELGLPSDNSLVQRFAVLSVAHEAVQALVASGHINDTSIGNLLKLDEALTAIRAQAPKKPLNVQIQFVGEPEHCPQCGYHYSGKGPLPKLKPVPKAIESTAAEAKPSQPPPTGDAAKPAAATPAPAPQPAEKQSARWSGQGDRSLAHAVDITANAKGWLKNGHGHSGALFGPLGGHVVKPAPGPGDPLYIDRTLPPSPGGKR